MDNTVEDERYHKRLIFPDPGDASVYPESGAFRVITQNISNGGLCMRTSAELQFGQSIDLIFDLPDDDFIETTGEVIWCSEAETESYQVGLRLASLSTAEIEKLDEHIFSQKPEHKDADPDAASDQNSDMRGNPRASYRTTVYFSGATAYVTDVSEGGCKMKTERPFDPGEFVSIVFSMNQSNRTKVYGKVIWSRTDSDSEHNQGIEFWHVNESCRRSFLSILTQKLR